jgi:hypothetical protein
MSNTLEGVTDLRRGHFEAFHCCWNDMVTMDGAFKLRMRAAVNFIVKWLWLEITILRIARLSIKQIQWI